MESNRKGTQHPNLPQYFSWGSHTELAGFFFFFSFFFCWFKHEIQLDFLHQCLSSTGGVWISNDIAQCYTEGVQISYGTTQHASQFENLSSCGRLISWFIPLSNLDANIRGTAHPGCHVNNSINYAFINPVRCHLGSMAVWNLRIVYAASTYADKKPLHRLGKFDAFLDTFYCIKSSFLNILVT